ncbi:ABC transporter permease [Mucilaginibacter sp. PPCGB 2223]|uniref:ABC transporter permease n=1 Tax=Mucilaginibacter sp. PPCGB 2223 TaxID=1886027 RepID=UPI000825151E|nr:ABC transporter permease [Mucilaginibacter sp. PPCGB 2223]OCX52186.1 ABC transporter permease [Mucilaginibacter sp. PPCGB 2223]
MLKNYVKIAWRNLIRNKVVSIINISGLAIGFACVLLIGLYIKNELSYDRFFNDAGRIYRVNLDAKMGNDEGVIGHTPPPAGAALAKNFPEIESYTRILLPGDEILHYENNGQKKSLTERNLLVVDSNFLRFFNYPLIIGDAATCFSQVNSLVLTQKAAKKYFGNESPVGKTLVFDEDQTPFVVTAVLKDIPQQSSLQFDMLRSTASFRPVAHFGWSWVWLQMGTYVKLKPNAPADRASIARLESKIPAMIAVEAASAFKRVGQPYDEFKRKGGRWDLKLQPLADVHLYSATIGTRYFEQGDIKYVYIFAAIGLFIMLLACVNFMNLSTAQSIKRSREVGIRKVLGSLKAQLIKQFITEAMLYSLLALIIAIALVILMLPAFNQLSNRELTALSLFNVKYVTGILLFAMVTGVFAGSYPAFFMTSFNPVNILKGSNLLKGKGSGFIRNGLVVFQFWVSTVLVICTIVVYKQLIYSKTQDLGFNKENIVIVPNVGRLGASQESLRQELIRLPQVVNAAISTGLPAESSFGDTYTPETDRANTKNAETNIDLSSFMVDEAFVPTLGLKLSGGRVFSQKFNDSSSVLLNETAVKQIGWKDPIGKTITYPGNNYQKFTVIGVLKDFNTTSFRNSIAPYALFYTTSKTYNIRSSYLTVRIKPGNYAETLNSIQAKWRQFAPSLPFDYSFMDAEFDSLYRSDRTMSKVLSVFTALSVSVACMGMLGLAMFTAERRTKEIGIRKVLGASVQNVVTMLSKEFVRLVLIASLLAFPVAWYAMNKWLQDFAYRTGISWWIFILASVLTMAVTLVTISFQSVKAAIANPVKSLRSE